eukprot:1160864-Pelagomonas_calceolata.AAC.2
MDARGAGMPGIQIWLAIHNALSELHCASMQLALSLSWKFGLSCCTSAFTSPAAHTHVRMTDPDPLCIQFAPKGDKLTGGCHKKLTAPPNNAPPPNPPGGPIHVPTGSSGFQIHSFVLGLEHEACKDGAVLSCLCIGACKGTAQHQPTICYTPMLK